MHLQTCHDCFTLSKLANSAPQYRPESRSSLLEFPAHFSYHSVLNVSGSYELKARTQSTPPAARKALYPAPTCLLYARHLSCIHTAYTAPNLGEISSHALAIDTNRLNISVFSVVISDISR
ncbi:hypothetical protein ONS95_005349 [Cadophora gregata]|uniref:uncharacterized protein n=1 Tax=Cadophora gregata TaxID=51156 RepID=UPI0026DCE24B|nr:uncharacterized protein ONS95_005349 [Cadophora gregata]KAK0103319.1 hypothetical protein ONS95_005349 [Cadophora gregata]